MATHKQVAQAFANGKPAKGSKTDLGQYRIYTDGVGVWSYGDHYLIAKHIGPQMVLMNADDYSVSTAKHKGLISRAIPANHTLMVPGLDYSTSLLDAATRDRIWSYHLAKEKEAEAKSSRARADHSRAYWANMMDYHEAQRVRLYAFAVAMGVK